MDIQELVAGIGSSQALMDIAGRLGIDQAQAQTMLHGILEHVTSGGQLDGMAAGVAARAGVDPAQVHQFLPSVMGLLEGHSQNASAGVQGMLGGLMSSLQGSPMSGLLSGGGASGGGVASEVLGLAKGLLG